MKTWTRRQWMAIGAAPLAGAAVSGSFCFSAEPSTGANVRPMPTAAEIRARGEYLWKLVDVINAYRKTLSLPAVPLSPSMTAVAALHAKDLAEQQPHKKHGSLHAWSDNTRWTGGNFLLDRPDSYNVMWQKPQEIAGYLGTGYEIAASGVRDADHALKVWQGSRPHLDVIANRGIWEELRWQALGAVYYKGFACAWFGEDKDE